MSLINVEHVTFGYDGSGENLFEDLSFAVDTDWKLGFIGRNGRGKTTFLRLLMGQLEYSGNISASVGFDYFPAAPPAGLTALEAAEQACPGLEQWRIERELASMDAGGDMLWRPFDTLSGGERAKLMLAAMFLREGRFLLIDEPTNHLDMAARGAVKRYLDRKRGYIVVSHDRAFLDGCIDHVLSLNRQSIEVVRGNFSSWWCDKENRDNLERERDRELRRDIARLGEAARRASDWGDRVEKTKYHTKNSGLKPDRGYIGARSAKLMKRAKAVEARAENAAEEKSRLLRDTERRETLRIHPLAHHSDLLVRLSDVAVGYGGRQVCGGVSFEVRRGGRVAICGGNGSGKSSLLKLIVGQDIAYSGTLELASGLKISYVAQDTSGLGGSLGAYAARLGIDETLFYTILRKMDFSRAQLDQDITRYSSGQKKKLLLAGSLCERAHLYIWDEPLNFIDMLSRIQIEELILDGAPSMVFVEHDEAFVKAVATGTVEL